LSLWGDQTNHEDPGEWGEMWLDDVPIGTPSSRRKRRREMRTERMTRRDFLKAAALARVGSLGQRSALAVAVAEERPMIQTVCGPLPPEELGVTLMHEHILVDFIGADRVSRKRYDPEAVFQAALPPLQQLRELGGQTLVECTPMYLGRDPALLRRLSEASGIHLLTNTGQYKEPFLPPATFTLSAEDLAQSWIAEAREGMEGTGIRPGVIKVAVNDGAQLIPIQEKIVRAAARTHAATGLPIAAHTGSGPVEHVLAVLAEEKVAAEAFIWVHAQAESDVARLARIAERGAWIELDGIAPGSVAQHVALVLALLERELGGRVLVSHDAGWYHVGEEGGGAFRPFDTLFTAFLPALRQEGVPEEGITQLLVDNPRAVLTPRVRRGE